MIRTLNKQFKLITMKKILVLFAAVTLSCAAQAQEVGIRWGDALGNNYAVDGIIALGDYSRIHADVTFGDGIGLEALYDFLYRPVGDSPINWYVGVGPSMRLDDPFVLGVSGEIGLAYYFDFPMSISADWRPTFVIIEDTDFNTGGFGINLRYVFGQ